MKRLRATAAIDKDGASPHAIIAAQSYLTTLLEERSEALGVALNWDSWRTHVRKNRHGDLVLTQWAKIA